MINVNETKRTSLPPISSRLDSGVMVITFGDFDPFHWNEYTDRFSELLSGIARMTRPAVVVEPRGDYFGSALLDQLLRLYKKVSNAGGTMAFVPGNSVHSEILRQTRLDQLWPCFATVGDAVTHLQSSRQDE